MDINNAEAVALLNEIANAIEAEPAKYNQAKFESVGSCGTAYCIAGWANHFTKAETNNDTNAERVLGLENDERLIFAASWKPAEYLSVPEALRKFASGASLAAISCDEFNKEVDIEA